MRARSFVLILIALVLAGSTVFVARAWLASQRGEPAAAAPVAVPPPGRSVLVAHAALTRGQILKPDDLVWQKWPDGTIQSAYFQQGARTPASFAGWVVRDPLGRGEPITDDKVIKPGDRGFLAAVLRPGMRAVSVPITATSGISGFVFPGDRVDLLISLAFKPQHKADPSINNGQAPPEHKAAETLLHNIRVIGIDQHTSGKPGEAVIAHTATLEVTPKQSEMIAVASEIGKLSLSLCSLVPATPPGIHPVLVADQPGHDGIASDSPGKIAPATYTIDSEISDLIPKVLKNNQVSDSGTVTILRGAKKTVDATVSQGAPRGE